MRKLGLFLVGLGAFLVILALMLRVYAYPKLAVAPADQNSLTVLNGAGATVFDISALSEITTDLTTQVVTVGDVEAAEEEGGNTVVWQSLSSTKSDDGIVRTRSIDRFAFDATTGLAVNCCDEFYETVADEPEPIEHAGQLVKFPFDTQKETYDWWDAALREAIPIEYVAEEEVGGVSVYKFEQSIPPTKTAEIDLPADLLGESGDETLTADRMYSNVRTLWIEPNTGVVINRTEQINNTIAYDGSDRITATGATNVFTEETIQENADTYGPLGSQLNLVRSVLPPLFLILGLLLLVGGFVLSQRRTASDDVDDEYREDEV